MYHNSMNNLLEKPKKSILLKIIVALLIIALVLAIAVLALYKAKVDIADNYAEHFDDIDAHIDEYSKQDKDLLNIVSYDMDKKTATFTFSKGFVYSNFDVKTHFDNFKNNLNIVINRFGYDVDPTQKVINVYADIRYKDFINTLVRGQIEYKISNDHVDLVLKDYIIGDNLPKSLVDKYVPYKVGELLYTFKTSDIEGLKEIGFDLSYLDNIEYTDNKFVKINANIETIALDLIDGFLDSLGIDESNEFYKQIKDEYIPQFVDSFLGNLDVNEIIKLIQENIEAEKK